MAQMLPWKVDTFLLKKDGPPQPNCGLTGSAGFTMRLGPGSALMLMVGEILEGFQRVSGGEIQAATRAEKAGSATLGALVHQRGPDERTRRQISQNSSSLA